MTLTYLDTSAAMKLIVDEPESSELVEGLATGGRVLAASWLLHTEMRCAAGRHPGVFDASSVQQVLDTVDLVDLTRGDMIAAGTHSPLRSHDALHLAVAIRLGVDEMATYDNELTTEAQAAGLSLFAPDAEPRVTGRRRCGPPGRPSSPG